MSRTNGTGSAPHADPYAFKWMIALGVTLASMMELVDTSIINVALSDMSANLGATIDEITWVSVGYILASVVVLPMTGWLSSYFGRKRYFLWSIAIFTVASFFCGQAHSLTSLVVWRIVQGLGGGALISTSQAILFEAFPPAEMTMAAAVFGIGMMIGPAIGPTLGGLIVDRFTWPWIFFVNLPIGLLALMVVSAYVRDSVHQSKPGRIDIPGFALLALGIGSLQFVLERGEYHDWFASGLIVGFSIVAAVSLLLMIWWELRVDEPVLNLRILRDRSLASGSVFAFVLGMALYGSVFALPLFMQILLGYDAETTGWLLLPGALGSAFAMFGIARFGDRIDMRWLVVGGALILAYSMHLHANFTLETGPHDFLWPVFLRGFGTGMMFVPLASSALANLHGRDMAEGTAIFNLTRQLGGSMGIAFLATRLTAATARNRAVLTEHVSLYDPATRERLAAMTHAFNGAGFDPLSAARKAFGALAGQLQLQALTLSYEGTFRLVGIIMVCSIPLVLLLRRPSGDIGPGH